MDIDKLVTMANQIGTFFDSYPDRAEARDEIANHLQRYWAPRMRNQLYAHIDTHVDANFTSHIDPGADPRTDTYDGNRTGLAPLVLAAIAQHRCERTEPPPPGGDAG